jgi:hypothetical protein
MPKSIDNGESLLARHLCLTRAKSLAHVPLLLLALTKVICLGRMGLSDSTPYS